MVVLIGLASGLLYGALGAGASAMATPLLALAGVPAIVAVAAPLPATIPAALSGAWGYRHDLDRRMLRLGIGTGLPAALAGALTSGAVPGRLLVTLSAAMLVLVGIALLRRAQATAMPLGPAFVVVGFTAGLLANSGGLLLVPVLLAAGLGPRRAAGTSLAVAAALSVPTLLTHWALGHVDWAVSATFAVGLVPGTAAGSRLSGAVPARALRSAFAVLVLGVAATQLMP